MADLRLCSIPTCDKAAHCAGLCNSHYKRNLRYGDPLKGRTPRNSAPAFLYDVVIPYRGTECLIWPFARSRGGYAHIRISQKTMIVPRIVCEAANGPQPAERPIAAHTCGKGHLGCVAPTHLQWKTHKENSADSELHGTVARGEKSGNSKLSDADVRYILQQLQTRKPKQIAAEFSVSPQTIRCIKRGERYHNPAFPDETARLN